MAIDIRAWYEKYGSMVFRCCKGMLHSEEDALDTVRDVFVQLRLSGGYKILPHLGIFAGVSYDFIFRFDDKAPDVCSFAPSSASVSF
jgi:hypothetical protein